jgi:phosphoribosyl 1,2-cyclic phosphate phosphodiesterase
MKITVLGCGGSEGVPSATGNWGACDPVNARNFRRRPAVLVEVADRSGVTRQILIDTPPELREQLAPTRVGQIDGVLLTHGHADHLHGIDDLRAFARSAGRMIPIYGEAFVIEELTERFAYAVAGDKTGAYRPILMPHIISGSFEMAGIDITAFQQDHGFGPSTGYRIGEFAYSIDVVRMPESVFDLLAGIRIWVVDCQQIEPHPSHSHLRQTLEWIRRLAPQRAILTHMGPRLDYATINAMLPEGVEAGYDGMVIE